MRILQVSPGYHPDIGGVERHLQHLSEELVRRGHEVTVATMAGRLAAPAKEMVNGVEVRRFQARGPAAYRWPVGLTSYLRRAGHRFDIVHGHNYHALPLLLTALTNPGRLLVSAYYHGHGHSRFADLLHRVYGPLANPLLRRARGVICLSSGEAGLVAEKLGVPWEKITVLPSGTTLLPPADPGSEERPGAHTLLTVGRLERYKRVDRLIEAVPFMPEGVVLDIVGVGPELPRLEARVRALGLTSRVRFLGRVDDAALRAAYARAAVFVSLSDAESFGITVLDALAAGCRVVASSIPAFRDFAESFPGSVALIAPEDAPRDIAASIRRVWNGPAPDAGVLARYSWDAIGRSYEQLYAATLEQPGLTPALVGR